ASGFGQFRNQPLVAQTESSFQQTAISLAPLQQQYGVTDEQIQKLNVDSAQLATIWGVTQPQAASVLQEVIRGNVQAGAQFNLNLVDQQGRIRGLNATYQELVQAMGPVAATQAVFAQVQQQVNQQITNFQPTEQEQQLIALNKAWTDFQSNLASVATGPITKFLTDINSLLSDMSRFLNTVAPQLQSVTGGSGTAPSVAAPQQGSSPAGAVAGAVAGGT